MIIESLELVNSQGEKTGYWRLTIRSGEKGEVHGLCNHLHESHDEAWNCLEAWEHSKKLMGDSHH